MGMQHMVEDVVRSPPSVWVAKLFLNHVMGVIKRIKALKVSSASSKGPFRASFSSRREDNASPPPSGEDEGTLGCRQLSTHEETKASSSLGTAGRPGAGCFNEDPAGIGGPTRTYTP